MSGTIALYVHMPFCRRKCLYCSFTSFEHRENDIPAYMSALEKELERRAGSQRISTIYIGGGTPTLISSSALTGLLNTIYKLCPVVASPEISIEANPGIVNLMYLKAIRELGVNRLSLGVQSFNDNELINLGRIHNSRDALEAIGQSREAGFDNINLDLIYGLPGQTKKSWQKSLEKALELKPEHLSLYALTLEEETPMQKMIDQGASPPIDSDLSADLYELASGVLGARDYRHYEISNWAKPGKECRHNLVYWHNLPYMGIGVAAHSFLYNHRLGNTDSLDEYLKQFSEGTFKPRMVEIISPELELAETIILGLRLDEGIQKSALKQRFGVDVNRKFEKEINAMLEAGLIEQNASHLKLTERGRFLSNEVFWRFLPEHQS